MRLTYKANRNHLVVFIDDETIGSTVDTSYLTQYGPDAAIQLLGIIDNRYRSVPRADILTLFSIARDEYIDNNWIYTGPNSRWV